MFSFHRNGLNIQSSSAPFLCKAARDGIVFCMNMCGFGLDVRVHHSPFTRLLLHEYVVLQGTMLCVFTDGGSYDCD